jgi:hypothetical protein
VEPVAFDHMEVRPADSTRGHSNEEFSRSGLWDRNPFETQGPGLNGPGRVEKHRLHCCRDHRQSSLGMFVYRRLVADQIHRQALAS